MDWGITPAFVSSATGGVRKKIHRKIVITMWKDSYDNKDLSPFQEDRLYANVLLCPRKNSSEKMHEADKLRAYTYADPSSWLSPTYLVTYPTKRQRSQRYCISTSFLQGAMSRGEDPTNSSNGGSRRKPHETPLTRPHRGAHLWHWSWGSPLSLRWLFALKAVNTLFFPYKLGGLKKLSRGYQQVHQLQKTAFYQTCYLAGFNFPQRCSRTLAYATLIF